MGGCGPALRPRTLRHLGAEFTTAEALITFCALLAYRRLTIDDGAAVSGYRGDRAND